MKSFTQKAMITNVDPRISGTTSDGGGTMIVNISNLEYDEGNAYYVGIADIPVAEIKAAWDDGQIIFANVTYPDFGVPTRLLCMTAGDTGDSETGMIAMFSTVIHDGNYAMVIGATIVGYGEYQMAQVGVGRIPVTSIE